MNKVFSYISATIAMIFIAWGTYTVPAYAESEGISGSLDFDNSSLTGENHPRLVFDNDGFKRLKSIVASKSNEGVVLLDRLIMNMADENLKDTTVLQFIKDKSNKRLTITGATIRRLASSAYAYRMTGRSEYLEYAERSLLNLCSYADWNPTHYLDVCEIACAAAIAYDWMYDDLQESTRKAAQKALKENVLETSRKEEYTWWYNKKHNWNQVCNAGLAAAAFAVYEACPEIAQAVIEDAVRTNLPAVAHIYAPDGAYPEGPAYWMYGTAYQVQLLTFFESVLGTDFGISSSQGFLKTGAYRLFSDGNSGHPFNFADTKKGGTPLYHPLWYFAAKNNNPGFVYNQIQTLRKAPEDKVHPTYVISALYWAMKMDLSELKEPEDRFYCAQGYVPMMICRSGWSRNDRYLAIKGGKAKTNHAHMDGGSFVYDAFGVRWAMDYYSQPYQDFETEFKKMGSGLFNMKQNSLRWRIFRINNRQHNTLTVNDRDHKVDGMVKMTDAKNDQGLMSATFDLTPLFGDDLTKAVRTASLVDNDYLQIEDMLITPQDRPAHVRWTMVSEGKPEITSKGIILRKNGKKMLLKATGADVTYRIWSSDPQDYESPVRHLDAPDPDTYICGYEVDLEKSTKHTITITLIKN